MNTTFFRDNQSIYLTFVILRWFSNNKSKHRWNATSCAEWRSCWRLYHLVVKLCNTFVHVYHSHIIFRPQKREPFLSFSQALLQLFVLRTATIATCKFFLFYFCDCGEIKVFNISKCFTLPCRLIPLGYHFDQCWKFPP